MNDAKPDVNLNGKICVTKGRQMRNSMDETTSKKGRHDSDPKSDNSVFWSDDETATTVANDDTDRFVKPIDT